jgi:hypothetical protein
MPISLAAGRAIRHGTLPAACKARQDQSSGTRLKSADISEVAEGDTAATNVRNVALLIDSKTVDMRRCQGRLEQFHCGSLMLRHSLLA